jgi:LacI family transcriptional regulator
MPSVIDDIARALNVSIATVSRALNDKPGVSAGLRQKVLDKARELNYAPNLQGRSLATSQTYGLGFCVREKPGLTAYSDPFYGDILAGFEQRIAKSAYHLTLATLEAATLQSPQTFKLIREQRVSGLVLAGPDIPAQFIIALAHNGVPVVLVDNRLDHHPIHSVSCNDEEGAYQAGRYLLARGHRRIGVIAGPAEWSSSAARVAGYRRALAEAGLQLPVIYAAETTMESGVSAANALFGAHPELTAIGAVNDAMALGVINTLQRQGLQVPGDMSVIGFDDVPWANYHYPGLTTLHVPKVQLGKEAAHRLLELLAQPELPATETRVAVTLVERGTVATISVTHSERRD